jgi:hypothetical protein
MGTDINVLPPGLPECKLTTDVLPMHGPVADGFNSSLRLTYWGGLAYTDNDENEKGEPVGGEEYFHTNRAAVHKKHNHFTERKIG